MFALLKTRLLCAGGTECGGQKRLTHSKLDSHSHSNPLLSSSLWVFGERPTELSKEWSECRRYQSYEEQINWRIDSTQGLPIYITGSTFIDAPNPNAACSTTVVSTKYSYSSLLTCMWLKFCDPENPTCCQSEMEKNIQTKV